MHEAMVDLVALLATLTDATGQHILVPGLMDTVRPFTTEERHTLESLDFDEAAFCKEVGTSRLRFADKVNLLAHRWRYPALSIHGIQGAFHGSGAKTVIPQKVVAKFSIRLVPDQEPEEVTGKVVKYLEEQFSRLNSPNRLRVHRQKGSRPWVVDPATDGNFQAAKNAIKDGWLKFAHFRRLSLKPSLLFFQCTASSQI